LEIGIAILQSISEWQHDKLDWSVTNAIFSTLISCHAWQGSLRNQKRGPDRSSTSKYLSFGAKTAEIGSADPEIICLRAIIKKAEKKQN